MTSWEYRFPESDVRHRRRKILFNRFLKVLLKVFFFFKNGPIPVSFCLFPPISLYNFNNTNWKKWRLCAWDSNPRPQDGKRRWIHGAMVAAKRSSLSSFHKMGQPRPLFHLFSSFQTNITILTTYKCDKCPSSIRRGIRTHNLLITSLLT